MSDAPPPPRRRRRGAAVVLAILLLLAGGALLGARAVLGVWHGPGPLAEPVQVVIPRGGTERIAATLLDRGVAALPIPRDRPVAYITQTTLSVDDTRQVIAAIEARFAEVVGPDTRDICYATQNRQAAVRELARVAEVVLVVGAANSSNSNRLREIAAECGVRAHLVADAAALDPAWLDGAATVGVTAGASAPERLVEELVARLRALGATSVEALPGIVEDVTFRLPGRLAAE